MKGFLLALLAFAIVILGYCVAIMVGSEGYFTYVLDDAYIHLAMAKNFAFHHIWGVTPYQFSSTSSSPLFTLVLSFLIKFFGNSALIPLFFNLVFGVLTIFLLTRYFSSVFHKTKPVVFAVLFTLLFAVFHLQILSGMEHVLQVFLFVLNVSFLIKWHQSFFKDKNAGYWFFFSLAFLGLIRFESMFYFSALILGFLMLKKWKFALYTALFGFLPLAAFCLINYQESGLWFPNSVLVKGTKFDLSDNVFIQLMQMFLKKIVFNTSTLKIAALPLVLSTLFFVRDYKITRSYAVVFRKNFVLIIFCLTMVLHLVFAEFKGFFRYEAYLLTVFCMLLIPRLKDFFSDFVGAFKKEIWIGCLIVAHFALLIYKTSYAHLMLVYGTKSIFEQQVQSARFLHHYYNTSKVVANDIGAICYYSDIHLLDVAGLGSAETIFFNENQKAMGQDFEDFLLKYTEKNNYQLAIIYEEWLTGHVPKHWRKAAVLRIPQLYGAAIDHVSVFAIDPSEIENLKKNIKNFNWNRNVTVEIMP